MGGGKVVLQGGRIPTLHALTDDGARFIESETGECPPRVLRSDPSPNMFLHRREIVRVMRAFDLGCDAVGLDRPDWIMEQDVWHAAPRELPPNQRRKLYHDLGNGLICQPDLAGRLTIGSTELALFWEIDLSTEGKKQLRKAAKTDSYVALFNERGYRRYWPDLETHRNYVIWVCPTKKRFRPLRDVLSGHPIAPVSRLLPATSLAATSSLLISPVWETIAGEQRVMYRPTT